MTRCVPAIVGLFGLVLLVGCKGETTYKDRPETLTELRTCKSDMSAKDTFAKNLQKQVAELETKLAAAGQGSEEVIVTVLDNSIKIKGGKGPNASAGDVKGNAKDVELYEAFIAGVNKSRGAIKKCYQAALKKDSSLQARTITLKIQVKYKSSGLVSNSVFSPTLSPAFDTCMERVTKRWKLPAMPRAMTLKFPGLSLSPT